MPLTRNDCRFCQYFHAQHDAVRCSCAACWRQRRSGDSASAAGRIAHPNSLSAARTSSHVVTSSPADGTVATASVADAEVSPVVAEGPCPHSAAPYHHCRGCVLPPYFERQQARWDGHAVVCAPSARQNEGRSRAATSRYRRGTSRVKAPMPPLSQYAAHEVPIMGPLASLYIKS
ncbi:hypothetical_protein [Leishmania major strain Friedlin]|nr:hypothetical_protein [Leishmania major strain Friedlin]